MATKTLGERINQGQAHLLFIHLKIKEMLTYRKTNKIKSQPMEYR